MLLLTSSMPGLKMGIAPVCEPLQLLLWRITLTKGWLLNHCVVLLFHAHLLPDVFEVYKTRMHSCQCFLYNVHMPVFRESSHCTEKIYTDNNRSCHQTMVVKCLPWRSTRSWKKNFKKLRPGPKEWVYSPDKLTWFNIWPASLLQPIKITHYNESTLRLQWPPAPLDQSPEKHSMHTGTHIHTHLYVPPNAFPQQRRKCVKNPVWIQIYVLR